MNLGVDNAKALIEQLRIASSSLRAAPSFDLNVLQALSGLRIAGRDQTIAVELFNQDNISVILEYASIQNDTQTRLEALRVIANALLLVPSLRADWDLSFAQQYIHSSIDEEFLVGRVMFLATVGSKGFKGSITKILQQYVIEHLRQASKRDISDSSNAAIKETCKLFFNILLHTTISDECELVVSLLVDLVRRLPHKFDLVSNILACLLKLPVVDGIYFPSTSPTSFLEITFNILEQVMTSLPYTDDSISLLLLLILTLLDKTNSESAITFVKSKVIPSDSERDRPLGQSASLAAKLLQATSDPALSKSKDVIFQLLWHLSEQDVRKFVHNIGLGYAIGFLMTNNVPIPDDLTGGSVQSPSMTQINPITGQRLDAEDLPSLEDMTDEEKEREAERLFVLFESALLTVIRMRQNGVVKVENPIRTAVESGRFEELH
ncbi:guanine nucleotide exchange factor [Lipomyces arxii]|uniref:guanine nucleotide exchange factor n=1 Tax=Lipomyces arxii TaxID=56418 RepID=UPI0034CEBA7D